MRANVIAFSLLTIFLAVLGLVPDMPWIAVKPDGFKEAGYLSLFQVCDPPVKINVLVADDDADDDDYDDDDFLDLDDDDGAGAASPFKKSQVCVRFRNNLPKGLDKQWKKLLKMRDGVIAGLALTIVLCVIAFIAGLCDAMVVAIVFLSLSVVFALTAVCCSVEMQALFKKATETSADDDGVSNVVNFHAGFYLAVLATTACLVGAITTTVTRKPSRPRHIVFANPNTTHRIPLHDI
eukprot:m.23342 g.23342  ORF g.23342 m.23342 type:complete len:237 (-) comp11367_c0_seq5:153-863(-)